MSDCYRLTALSSSSLVSNCYWNVYDILYERVARYLFIYLPMILSTVIYFSIALKHVMPHMLG